MVHALIHHNSRNMMRLNISKVLRCGNHADQDGGVAGNPVETEHGPNKYHQACSDRTRTLTGPGAGHHPKNVQSDPRDLLIRCPFVGNEPWNNADDNGGQRVTQDTREPHIAFEYRKHCDPEGQNIRIRNHPNDIILPKVIENNDNYRPEGR